MPFKPLIAALLDPRGRCNRKGLFVAAVSMLGVEIATSGLALAAGYGLDAPVLMPAKLVLFYAALAVAAQRLHDLGLSAWRMLWAAVALIAWSFAFTFGVMVYVPPENMAPGGSGFAIVLAGVGVPMLALLLWLHFAPGMAGPNRFGPVPDALGFSQHMGRRREAPVGGVAATA